MSTRCMHAVSDVLTDASVRLRMQAARIALATKLREASRPLAAVADPKRPHVTISLKVGDDERTRLCV